MHCISVSWCLFFYRILKHYSSTEYILKIKSHIVYREWWLLFLIKSHAKAYKVLLLPITNNRSSSMYYSTVRLKNVIYILVNYHVISHSIYFWSDWSSMQKKINDLLVQTININDKSKKKKKKRLIFIFHIHIRMSPNLNNWTFILNYLW